MKTWRSFGSGHSAHLTVIGTFKSIEDAELAEKVVRMWRIPVLTVHGAQG